MAQTRRNRALVIVIGFVIAVAATIFMSHGTSSRYFLEMRMAEVMGAAAKRVGLDSLQNASWNWRREAFDKTLSLRVDKNELVLVRAQFDFQMTNIHKEFREYARSHDLRLAFTRSDQLSSGKVLEIYAEVSDRRTIESYLKGRGGALLTDPVAE